MKRANRLYLGLLMAFVLVYAVMLFWSLPLIRQEAGGLPPFDLRPFGYDTAEARAFLQALSAEGRSHYLNAQHRLDLVFPGLLAVVLTLSFHRLAKAPLAWALSALAVAAACLDWMENAAVARLLQAGPAAATEAMIASASRWTELKSAIITIALVALLALVGAKAWRRCGPR